MDVSSNDAKRAELEALVNQGKLSKEEAVAIAEKLGLISAPKIERTTSLSKTTQLYNFSVYKWSKGRTVQRLILQFDFQSLTLSSIQHGTRTKKIDFGAIISYQSEDGLRLSIKFSSQPEYELDADTQEDKNKMCRLLEMIIRNYKQTVRHDSYVNLSIGTTEPSEEDSGQDSIDPQSSTLYQPAENLPEQRPLVSTEQLQPSILTPAAPSLPIKEGMVEKRGHSAKALIFSRRWLRVFKGELLYYKPDDLENALNIIPLNPDVTEVSAVSNNRFIVSLSGSDKKFDFRTFGNPTKTAQQLRDEWCKAITDGLNNRSGGLNHGTLTAKDMAPRRNTLMKRTIKKQHTADKVVDPFEEYESGLNKGDLLSSSPSNISKTERHWTISSLRTRFSFKKANSFAVSLRDTSDDSVIQRRRDRSLTSSTFYDDENMAVTKNVVEPADFSPLSLTGKSMNELLMLLKSEFEPLSKILEGMTTGSSRLDMMVVRLSSIINALENNYTDVTGEELSEPLCESELSKRLSAVNESNASSHSNSRVTSPAKSSKSSNRESQASIGSGNEDSTTQLKSPLSPSHTEDSQNSSSKMSRSVSPSSPSELLESDHDSLKVKSLSPTPNSQSEDTALQENPPPVSGMPPPAPPVPGMPPLPPGVPPPPMPPGIPPPPMPPGIPPPPLPPGVPPPPGLLGGMQSSILPPRKLIKPETKMRRFYWSSLPPQQVMKCGWMDWSSDDYTDFLDLKSLESLFGVEEKPKQELPAKKKVEVKTLLDTTRNRNIGIFLPSLPLSLDTLQDKLSEQLNNINDNLGLELDHIVALKRYQPSEDEKDMYKNYKDDKSLLQPADIFLMKLCAIPMLSTRLDLLFTVREFPANFEEFQPTLELAWHATNELKKCEQFIEILKFILAIGNYLNFGTRQGAAYGFKLSVIPKLSESSGQDKKTTLMHYLIKQLHDNKPDLLQLPEQLESVSKSSDISITGISAELEVMQRELDKIERFANKIVGQSHLSAPAAQKLLKEVKGFTSEYRDKLSALNLKGVEMSDNFRELLVKFGEPLSTDSEDFFGDVAKFVSQFKRVRVELFPPKKPAIIRSSSPNPGMNNGTSPKVEELAKSTEAEKTEVIKVPISPQDSGSASPTIKSPTIKSPLLQVDTDKQVKNRRGFAGSSRKLQPKEGTLEKRTKDGKKWQKKHFELERGQLHYYEGKGQKYADTIRLHNIPIEIDSSDPKIMIIKAESRVFHLRAESAASASSWCTALKNHSQGTA